MRSARRDGEPVRWVEPVKVPTHSPDKCPGLPLPFRVFRYLATVFPVLRFRGARGAGPCYANSPNNSNIFPRTFSSAPTSKKLDRARHVS
jgi:hypothetical protein